MTGEPTSEPLQPPGESPREAAWQPPPVAVPTETAALLPLFLQPRWPMPHRERFGRLWPEARAGERAFWGLGLAACLVVLYLAAFVLTPDRGGVGTHTQLGLPPCGFVEMTGGPCPSCGYTTTFTLAAHGHVWAAVVNQPFGFLVFLLTVLAVPLTAFSLLGGVSLFSMTERWPWKRLLALFVAGWLVAWGYKWAMMA